MELKAAGGKKSGKRTSRPSTVKYRTRESGGSWTGRRKQARWLTEELETGKKLEDFAV
jgi:DNA-binding protein H-NS